MKNYSERSQMDLCTGRPSPLRMLILVLLLGASTTEATGRPATVNVTDVKYNGFTVTFDAVSGASSYTILLQAKHDSSLTYQQDTAATSVVFSNIADNRLYEIKVDADNSKNYTTTEQRTPPNGVTLRTSDPIPEIFTVFMEAVPGASQWEIEVNNTDDGAREVVQTKLGTYYAHILSNRFPNTNYSVRSRVSVLNGIPYDDTSSPYGPIVEVTTAKTSLFGRVKLNNEEYVLHYSNTSSSDFINATLRIGALLKDRYTTRYPFVHDVLVLEFENDTGKVVCQHEIVVINRTTVLDDSWMTDESLDDVNLSDLIILTKGYNLNAQGDTSSI